MKSEFAEDSFDLVHAALVFEYIEWPSLLPHIASWLRPGGTLSIVVQRPSVSTPAVTPTPFTSLLALESIFRFVEPETLVNEAERCGFVLTSRQVVPLPSRKTFEALRLRGE